MAEDRKAMTDLLRAHAEGDPAAFERLVQVVYPHLKRIAARQLGKARHGFTLDATSLVNEAWIKLVDHGDQSFVNRAHFFAVTARAMRQIIIDHARRKQRAKRGAGERPIPLDERVIAVERQADQLVELNEVLERLAETEPRLSSIVECRFFGGLTVEETAAALSISQRTVEREWKRAKELLRREMRS